MFPALLLSLQMYQLSIILVEREDKDDGKLTLSTKKYKIERNACPHRRHEHAGK